MEPLREAWAGIARLWMGDEVHSRLTEACASARLPHPGALKTLLLLDADEPPPMRSLAGHLRIDASYMTVIVDALEELGYVERRPSPTDRRVKLVQITDKGVTAREQAIEVISTPPSALQALNANEARTLARLVAKISPPE